MLHWQVVLVVVCQCQLVVLQVSYDGGEWTHPLVVMLDLLGKVKMKTENVNARRILSICRLQCRQDPLKVVLACWIAAVDRAATSLSKGT